MAWQVLHYLGGFRRLGFDVWYVEDADVLYRPGTLEYAPAVDENVRFLAAQMSRLGLSDRWLFRTKHLAPEWYGNGGAVKVARLQREADAVINLCGNKWVSDARPNLLYLETDPGEIQIHVANGNQDYLRLLERHRWLYTYGVNIGTPRSPIPVGPLDWHPTRPPVILDWWRTDSPPASGRFTTVAQWHRPVKPPLQWHEHRFEWRKDHLFERVIDLPTRTSMPLELALRSATDRDRDRLRKQGWIVSDARRLDPPVEYRGFVQGSAGEFTIAKDQYTRLRTGWFSDRSVCYLAAGRPVVTQATGFEYHIPTGEGLFAFDDTEAAANALEAIADHYQRHAQAALELAREYFAVDRVLPGLIEDRSTSCPT
ncbi:MAG TPA: hypothetical protein VFB34_02930 [Chloroflexota bacterium]|nr:hypothetical protein [Chloroflexota bacterium]